MDIANILYQYLLALAEIASFSYSTDIFKVSINTSNVLNVVDQRYLSLSFSPRFLGNSTAHALFRTKRFQSLLQGLAPCYLRAGGTAGESVTFNRSHSPPDYEYNVDGVEREQRKFQPITMYANFWDFINQLATQNGAQLLYQINDMKRTNGHWDDSNFRELLDYAMDKPYARSLGFEFGNEPNAYRKSFNVSISATQHAHEFRRASQILKHQQPYASVFRNSILATPDVTQPKKKTLYYMKEFLSVAGDHVDKITWHQYYLRGKSPDPIGLSNFTDPLILDHLATQIRNMQQAVEEVGFGHKDMWLGETSSASGGGVHAYSNRYVAGFMWLDKLGLAAEMGLKVVIRQTLYGFDNHYPLIYDDVEPLPDYWLSHLYKLLVGRTVYQTNVSDKERKLRCYSSSYASDGTIDKSNDPDPSTEERNITLYCLNLNKHNVHIQLEIDMHFDKIYAYALQAHGEEGLQSRHVQLNGAKLEMVDDRLPPIKPVEVNAHAPLTIPASSMVFYTIQ